MNETGGYLKIYKVSMRKEMSRQHLLLFNYNNQNDHKCHFKTHCRLHFFLDKIALLIILPFQPLPLFTHFPLFIQY